MSKNFFQRHCGCKDNSATSALLGIVAGAGIAYFIFGTERGEELRFKLRQTRGKLKRAGQAARNAAADEMCEEEGGIKLDLDDDGG